MRDLTTRQLEVLTFICASIRQNAYPPTVREIGAGLGIRSTNGVMDHLKALVSKGFVEHRAMLSRGLVLTEKAWARLGPDDTRARVAQLRAEIEARRAELARLEGREVRNVA